MMSRLKTSTASACQPGVVVRGAKNCGCPAAWLRECGYEVHEGIGVTGVVGVLARGDEPVVLLAGRHGRTARGGGHRPVLCEHGARPRTEGVDVPVMHACGHDMHVTCLMGAAATLAESTQWAGTLVVLFQPAEEVVRGDSR